MIKTRANELAFLGKLVDDEDLINQVLEGLSDEYKSLMQLMPVTRIFLLLSSMRNFSTKKHLFRPLNLLLYHYQQRKIPQPSRIIQIGVHQPPLHNNQALSLRFLLMINANPNLI